MATFDPDAYLATKEPASFDPDTYLAKAATPVPTAVVKPLPASSAPVEGEGGAAFGIYPKQRMRAAPEPAKPAKPDAPTIPIADLSKKPEFFEVIKDYMKVSGQPAYKEGTSKEDYVKDFMSQRRFAETNTLLGAVPELVRLKTGTTEAKGATALGRQLYEQTASAFTKEGQAGVRPYLDVVKAIVSDPLTYAGMGVGKAVTSRATKEITKGLTDEAIKAASKKAITKGTLIGGGVEATIGSASDITAQRAEQETAKLLGQEPEKLDLLRAGTVGMVTGLLGAGSARATMKTQVKETVSDLSKALEKKAPIVPTSPTAPPTPVEKVAADALRDNMDEVHNQYIKQYGEEFLGVIDPVAGVADNKIKTELSKSAVRMAMKVIELDPTFQLKPNEQISTAINKVFANIDKIDDVVLENALTASGLTPREFAMANKVSVSEGARLMQQYSVAGKLWKKMQNIDPAFEKQMKELYGVDNDTVGATSKFFDGVRAVERESKVWITSGIDTLVRNAIGTNINITAKAAVNLMEGLFYTGGVAMQAAATGKGTAPIKQAFSDTIKNSFSTLFYLKNNGLAADVTDELLKYNPSLKANITSALQDTGNEEISRVGRWASSLNASVDAFYRRAAFTASVEKQLRAQGLDLYKDFLAKDSGLPTAVLSRGIDDALKTTLSYMPKIFQGPGGTVEQLAESGASRVVNLIEKTPFASLAIPFPRFMSNALALQYRYSPLGMAGVGSDLLQANKFAAEGLADKATLFRRQAAEKFAQSSIGVGALVAAYDYREKNQDTPWSEVKTVSGTTTDIKAIFPVAPYFAVADVLVKHNKGLPAKSAEAMEAVLGMKTPAGTQATFIDQVLAAFDSERDLDKASVTLGKVFGDFAGRFTQPFVVKQIYDYIDLVREEGTKARDPNLIESEGFLGSASEAAVQRVAGRLPIAKEELPAAVARLKEEPTIYKEGEFFNRLVGFRPVAERSPVEKEVVKLGLDPYRVYGSSSGDKVYDRKFIEKANELVLPFVSDVIKDPSYQQRPLAEQRKQLSNALNKMSVVARTITAAEMKGEDLDRVYKMRFNKLPEIDRRIINERYAKEHGGVTFEEAKAYKELDGYEAGMRDLGFASGGSVESQTRRMLSR